jgi:GWxTD domain-containing protein
VEWIIGDQERADFKKLLSDKQRDSFVVAFWERRNPTPGAAENKFKEDHYRRLAYANEHFAARIAGSKTDRGRIYIVYGPPDSVERHPETTASDPKGIQASRFPFEVWHYGYIEGLGKDVVIEFVDTCRCGEYDLTRSSPSQD